MNYKYSSFLEAVRDIFASPCEEMTFNAVVPYENGWEIRNFPINHTSTGSKEKDDWLDLFVKSLRDTSKPFAQELTSLIEALNERGNSISKKALNDINVERQAGSSSDFAVGISIQTEDGGIRHALWRKSSE